MILQVIPSLSAALPVRSFTGAADYCAYPVASMESEALVLPETLPPGVTL